MKILNLLLFYPTQTPLLHSGSRLDRSGGFGGGSPPTEKRSNLYDGILNQYILVYRREILNLFVIYPTQTPLLHSASRLDRSGGFGGGRKTIEFI